MSQVYFGDWKDSGYFGMVADFAGEYITEAEFHATESPYANVAAWNEHKNKMRGWLMAFEAKPEDIVFAVYTYEEYSGDALVVFQKNGKLFEVNGSHCSCFGLSEEDYSGRGQSQWDPEETTVEALLKRSADGYGVIKEFGPQLAECLARQVASR